MCPVLLSTGVILTGHWWWRHASSWRNRWFHCTWGRKQAPHERHKSRFLKHLQWIYMSFGCKLEKSFTWLWRWSSIMPIERLCWTRAKPTLVAPHPWLGLGVGGCSNITLLTHVERPVTPGWLLTTWFKYTIYSQQPVGKCCVHVYKEADIWPRAICHMDLWIASSEIRQEQPFQWLIDSVIFLPPPV